MIALLAIPYAVIGAILNHWRGGHKYPLIRHLPGSRYWLAGYYTIPAVIMLLGTSPWWTIPFVIAWFALSWDALRRGWGTYMSMGQPDYLWMVDPEVRWIDWFLNKTFGPFWIPVDWRTRPAKNGVPITPEEYAWLKTVPDRIDSPTGNTRGPNWSFWRAFVGMCLRGLHYSVPLTLMLVIANWLEWTSHPWWALVSFAFSGLLMGPAYLLGDRWDWLNKRGFGETAWGSVWAAVLWLIATSSSGACCAKLP